MPSANEWAYFDHAAVCPLSTPAAEAIREWSNAQLMDGAINWNTWRDRIESLRHSTAQLLNARSEEIAIIRNTTEGVCLVAEGFPWQAGDNVVVPASEFPSNLYAWKNLSHRGVEVRVVDTDLDHVCLDRLSAACDERTQIIAVSWVGYRTGFRLDLAAVAQLAHSHQALLFVDVIQGLGALQLDVVETGIDALAADGHKWLLGPEGAGIFYLRAELLETFRPLGIGWNSVVQAGNFADTRMDLKPAAGRYEGGTYNMAGNAALLASIDWLLEFDAGRIQTRILEKTDDLCHRLQAIGADIASDRSPARASGIVSFNLPDRDPREVRRTCQQQGVVLNCRDGRLRASPHAYVTNSDLDRLVAALQH